MKKQAPKQNLQQQEQQKQPLFSRSNFSRRIDLPIHNINSDKQPASICFRAIIISIRFSYPLATFTI